MEKIVNIYLFGKKYSVPEDLTIMRAMEYAGYQLVRGCGCRNGFCGACATIYRIKGDRELKTCLACQTKVENDMYIATLPFFPLVKQVYDIEKVKPPELHAEFERYAVYRIRSARRVRQMRGRVFRLRYVRRMLLPLSRGHFPSSGGNACPPTERQVPCPQVTAS